MLYEHGICISYNRVLEISTQLGDATVSKYVEDRVVCPLVLRTGLFITSAMDNIDHNITATIATTSFHGTSISVFQLPTKENKGAERGQVKFGESEKSSITSRLLHQYTTNLLHQKETLSSTEWCFTPRHQSAKATAGNGVWEAGEGHGGKWTIWCNLVSPPCFTERKAVWGQHYVILPLLRDEAHSVTTIKHVINKIRKIVAFLDPSQEPVIAADQPIYAVAKQVQWHWPEINSEDKFVIMPGVLHIEVATRKSIETPLGDNGWIEALVEAGIASPGTADLFLKASRTRQMNQVIACSLYKLLKVAHTNYLKETDEPSEDVPSFEA